MSSRWNILWAAPWGLVSWLVVELLVFAPVALAGLLLLPALLLWAPIAQAESRVNAGVQVEAFAWAWANTLWGNMEDGLSPAWWTTQCGAAAPTWRTRMTWFLRNPVCNMRFWPVVSTLPELAQVRWIGTDLIPPDGTPGCFLCWQGGFVGFRWQCRSWGVWAGWKVSPADRAGCEDYRRFGIGTAGQVMRFS